MSDAPTPADETPRQEARRLREAALAALVDVTAEFQGLNREDTILRDPDTGYQVKVKMLLDRTGDYGTSAPGLFHVTGAIVGPDGKALMREDGSSAVWKTGRTWAHRGHTLRRPEAGADLARRQCALETIASEMARDLITGDLDGYETVEAFQARKAAEAAA